MKHLFTLNARFIGSFVFIFILIIANTLPAESKGGNDAGISAISSPATIFCEGTYSVIATLKNNGNLVLKTAIINWSILGVSASSQSFIGNLKPDSTISINLGTYAFTAGSVILQVYSSMPNGKTDSFPNNDTITETLNILANSSANAGAPFSICSGNTANIGGNASPGYIYSWTSNPAGFTSFSANPTIVPYSTAYYILTVKNLSGCTATDSVLVTVNQTPNAYAGPDQSICLGQSTTIGYNSTPGHTYFWSSSPAVFTSTLSNPTVRPSSSITYFLTENVPATGCSNSHAVVITVLPNATAIPISGPINVCPGSSAIYTPSFQGNGYYYTFRFGDSSGTTGNSFVQSYDTAYVKWGSSGKLTLWLISQNIAGCSDSANLKVNITNPPVANFNATESCAKLATSFSNTSGSAVTAKWYFGDTAALRTDNDTSSGLKTTHTYKSGGQYKVKMVVANIAGCSDSVSQFVVVDSLPIVNFIAPKKICLKNQVMFQNTSPSALDSFYWIFGDGSIDTSASHIYTNIGIYKASLVATSPQGCIDTINSPITVNPLPSPAFVTSRWTYRNYNFEASDTTQTSYSWDFGDTSALGIGFKVSHDYVKNGLHSVLLDVTNKFGCSATKDTVLNVTLNGINLNAKRGIQFGIYPNPFNDKTLIEYSVNEMTYSHISLTDITGKYITDIVNTNQVPGNYSYIVDAVALGLKPGIYIVNANINGANVVRQIIKLN